MNTFTSKNHKNNLNNVFILISVKKLYNYICNNIFNIIFVTNNLRYENYISNHIYNMYDCYVRNGILSSE